GTYTEIIFPDDQSGAPASQAAADTPASSAAAESESTNDSTNDSESATDHDAQ
ncbi:MAG: DivIVA domain-containing protein, partial [Lacticaseibacillus paracasei]|nr:DivIVA domain-containing protein [Lacticaseibacillus paracasei]